MQAPRSQVEFTAELISAVNSTWLLHLWVSEGGDVEEIPAEKGAGKHKHCAKLGPEFMQKSCFSDSIGKVSYS